MDYGWSQYGAIQEKNTSSKSPLLKWLKNHCYTTFKKDFRRCRIETIVILKNVSYCQTELCETLKFCLKCWLEIINSLISIVGCIKLQLPIKAQLQALDDWPLALAKNRTYKCVPLLKKTTRKPQKGELYNFCVKKVDLKYLLD